MCLFVDSSVRLLALICLWGGVGLYLYGISNPAIPALHEVMLALVTLIHCAICYASYIQLDLSIQHSYVRPLVMPEESDDADTSKTFVKDLDNIRRQDFLLQVDLEDPDVAREHWIGLRSKTLERFGLALMHDPLWDYAANLKGDDAKFDDAVRLKNYRGYGAKIGHPRDMQTISQKTLRFRAIAMIKAHLPSGIEWFTEISTLPDDQSVYSWYAHNDLVYLAVDREIGS